MMNEDQKRQAFPWQYNICAVCRAINGTHVYGCAAQRDDKWICRKSGHWVRGAYQIVEHHSNNPQGYDTKIWNVWHAGEIVRGHSVLKRAKLEAQYHAEQIARGITQY